MKIKTIPWGKMWYGNQIQNTCKCSKHHRMRNCTLWDKLSWISPNDASANMSAAWSGRRCSKTLPCWTLHTRSCTPPPSRRRLWPAAPPDKRRSRPPRTPRTGSHRFRRQPARPCPHCNRRQGSRRRSPCCRCWRFRWWTPPGSPAEHRFRCTSVRRRSLRWCIFRHRSRRSGTLSGPKSGRTSRPARWAGLPNRVPGRNRLRREWRHCCRRVCRAKLCNCNDFPG